jgi:predicted GTPase
MTKKERNTRIIILGAAGRDFHNFNLVYRDDPGSCVIAFTATQIPGIEGRRYPPELAGPLYPDGIPIVAAAELESLCHDQRVERVVFAYSDVPHATVMHLASKALAGGADFVLLGPRRTWLASKLPVIAVSAVRTGCGKSQVARYLSRRLRKQGWRVAVLRHPMPYGDLARQAVQRFATRADLDRADCTVEEREEYEPHIAAGGIVFAGVDYARILEEAEREADLVLWEGGNNDLPFIRPDLHLVLADALRPGQETAYHPGETVLRMADAVIIAKTDAADPADVARVEQAVHRANPKASVLYGASPVRLDDPQAVRGKRALVVEDGPTITHGGMPSGAGLAAARAEGARDIVDPRPFAAPAIARLYERYPHIGPVLPAVGYSADQLEALARTINAAGNAGGAEVVVAATPADLAALIPIDMPVVRARYDYAEASEPGLAELLDEFLKGAPRPASP